MEFERPFLEAFLFMVGRTESRRSSLTGEVVFWKGSDDREMRGLGNKEESQKFKNRK